MWWLMYQTLTSHIVDDGQLSLNINVMGNIWRFKSVGVKSTWRKGGKKWPAVMYTPENELF